MILDKVDYTEIDRACDMIRRYKEQPIMYISNENARNLVPAIIEAKEPVINKEDMQSFYSKGIIGYFHGCIVYATKEVGDKIVIVPMYKEDNK